MPWSLESSDISSQLCWEMSPGTEVEKGLQRSRNVIIKSLVIADE